jgi:AraC-like DNA-binding protein
MYDELHPAGTPQPNQSSTFSSNSECCDFIELILILMIKASDWHTCWILRILPYIENSKKKPVFFINDYIKAAKIERGKVLLSSSDHSVPGNIQSAGISNRSYFSQFFRELTGQTPVSFRESASFKSLADD